MRDAESMSQHADDTFHAIPPSSPKCVMRQSFVFNLIELAEISYLILRNHIIRCVCVLSLSCRLSGYFFYFRSKRFGGVTRAMPTVTA